MSDRRKIAEALPMIGQGLTLVSEELDSLRDAVKDGAALAPVLAALGEVKLLIVETRKDIALLDEKFEAHRRNSNEQIRELKKKVFNGPPAAE